MHRPPSLQAVLAGHAASRHWCLRLEPSQHAAAGGRSVGRRTASAAGVLHSILVPRGFAAVVNFALKALSCAQELSIAANPATQQQDKLEEVLMALREGRPEIDVPWRGM